MRSRSTVMLTTLRKVGIPLFLLLLLSMRLAHALSIVPRFCARTDSKELIVKWNELKSVATAAVRSALAPLPGTADRPETNKMMCDKEEVLQQRLDVKVQRNENRLAVTNVSVSLVCAVYPASDLCLDGFAGDEV
jgi:hypothetical protein